MLKVLTTSLIICFLTIASSSQVTQQWVRTYNGPGDSTDYAQAMAVDIFGNSYVTGVSKGSGTNYDYATIKYNSAGVQQWVARFNGPGNGADKSYSIGLDPLGNVYVTGTTTHDASHTDMTTIKYNNSGVQQWASTYPGTICLGGHLAVDLSGNVFVTGAHDSSIVTIKYNTAGVQQWVATYAAHNLPSMDQENKFIKLDNSGNVLVAGLVNANIAPGGWPIGDIVVIKYNSAGVQQWAMVYNNPVYNADDEPRAMKVDHNGNVYVAGESDNNAIGGNFLTLKVDQNGNLQWSNILFTTVSGASDLCLDSHGNIIVTGSNSSSPTASDIILAKYSPAGNLLWQRSYAGPSSSSSGMAVVSDIFNNFYISGFSFSSPQYKVTLKYNSAGNLIWSHNYLASGSGPIYDGDSPVAIDLFGNVYTSGGNLGEPEDFVTIKYSQDCDTISGHVTYKDNNQPVNQGGFAKALYYDDATATVYTVDSAAILTNGTYMLAHCPQQVELYIMVYQNDDQLDYVPTYYPATIDWQQATQVITTQNYYNINVQVDKITNVTNPFSISGMTLNSGGSGNLDNAVIYAKIGNVYKNYGISSAAGSYIADKLPAGSYTLTAFRIGYNSVSQNVTIVNGNLTSVNFDFGNPIGIITSNTNIPSGFRLYQNYPNPFNPETRIRYDVVRSSKISVKIFDVLGRVVAEPVNALQNAGSYDIAFDASSLASGVYFYRLSADGVTVDTKKMLMVK